MGSIQTAYTVLGSLGILMATLGYLIKFKKMINLIAGVRGNEQFIKDKQGLANCVGSGVLVLGIMFFAGALVIYNNPEHKYSVETVLLLSLLVIGGIIFSKAKEFVVRDKEDKNQ